ncbi:phosphatase [Anoxynatronum sibiricum]|uniref:Phosphatase n=1 Tax=Anoxynatronum sibiricum TaxID=210623 RepID=A0ABU9VWQ9_9CLOT
MKIAVDTHTHTIASSHAYSTVDELAAAAAQRGLSMLCITDHAPGLMDSPHLLHFMNYHVLDREIAGVSMLYGVELNIMDRHGKLDMPEEVLQQQDLCIASYHEICTAPGTRKDNTRAYVAAMNCPYVNIIGHPDDGRVPVDFETLVKEARETGVLLEVNNASLKSAHYRLNTRENLTTMLTLCQQYQVSVVLGSDAHYRSAVGDFQCVLSLLNTLDFPEELVANTSVEKFRRALRRFSSDSAGHIRKESHATSTPL